jgi:peptide deformylase
MSETLIINTEAGLANKEELGIEPLPLFDETHAMLGQIMPEYKGNFPNDRLTVLAKRLKMTMKLYGGVGLSANQCGVMERMFIMGDVVCINPKIVDTMDGTNNDREGCLSFPGLSLAVHRPASVLAEWTNEKGEVLQSWLHGLNARIFQHELDHMNGIRFVQKVGPTTLRLAREKQQKLIKKITRQQKKL